VFIILCSHNVGAAEATAANDAINLNVGLASGKNKYMQTRAARGSIFCEEHTMAELLVDLIMSSKRSEEELLRAVESLQGRLYTMAARLLSADMRLTIATQLEYMKK
jgi:hypothetical protein